ncbi:MAG: D-2-hydroxyacid dehydrogenase [Lachnospiraceae bacterium]|nr:D-2-hydroxyacid dehydrogenase [Candidatus Colinaster equi]
MKIVELDRNTLGYDIDTSIFKDFGDFEEYVSDEAQNNKEHIKDADVVIFNKAKMNEEMLKDAKNVKLLCITATGYDNIDLKYCRKRGIAVCNVKAYSTQSVAQHTFALALYVLEKINYYDDYVKSGKYSAQSGFCNFDERFCELDGKTWGIIGMGNIGKAVAKIATAFGCHVIHYSASGTKTDAGYEEVGFEDLLSRSDILSLHCPLSEKTLGIMNMDAFSKMKKTAILVNVSRGPVVNEEDLRQALEKDMIAGAGLDVLSVEPMQKDNPLSAIKDSRKLLITPHMAWASVEARQRCANEVYKNIEAFVNNEVRNRVDL